MSALGCVMVVLGSLVAVGGGDGGTAKAGSPATSGVDVLATAKAKYEEAVRALGDELLKGLDTEKAQTIAQAGADPDRAHRQVLDLDKQREALLEAGAWPSAISSPERKLWFEGRDHAGVQDAFRQAKAKAVGTALFDDINAELEAFNTTNDLAPWQDLTQWCVPGDGREAWDKVGGVFKSPPTSAGGATNPLRFRRPLPAEYKARFVIKKTGPGAVVLGLQDSAGQAFQVPLTGDASAGSSDSLQVVVCVQTDRVLVDVDGRSALAWRQGQPFPVATALPSGEGPELAVSATKAESAVTVSSAELKCLGRFGTARAEHADVPKPNTKPVSQSPSNVAGPKRAILEGTDWLVRHQGENGAWSTAEYSTRCLGGVCTMSPPVTADPARPASTYDVGVTGLATRALIRAWDQVAKAEHQKLGDGSDEQALERAAKAGVTWLISQQNEQGSFTPDRAFMYNEAIAAQALVEAYRVFGTEESRASAERAIQFLQAEQRPSPDGSGLWGWHYESRQVAEAARSKNDDERQRRLCSADTSVTGWCVAALQAGRVAGLQVDKDSMDGGLAFVKWCTSNDGLVGYADPKTAGLVVQGAGDDRYDYHATSMSALGMCIRLYCQHDPKDTFLEPAAQRILKDLPTLDKDRRKVDYYYWHAAVQALSAWDGPVAGKHGRAFAAFSKAAIEALLQAQDQAPGACSRGAWLIGDRWGYAYGGPIYGTAINVLTLEDALGWK